MPRAIDTHPLVIDRDPLRNILGGIPKTPPVDSDALQQAANDWLRQKTTDILVWIRDATGIDLTGIPAWLDWLGEAFGADSFAALLDWLNSMLVSSSALNAANLYGLLPPGIYANIPLSSISDVHANLLLNGGFDSAACLVDAVGKWQWDSEVYWTPVGEDSSLTPGSGRVVADGAQHVLTANEVVVEPGQTLGFDVQVAASGLVRTGTPLQVRVIGAGLASPVVVAQTGTLGSGAGVWHGAPAGVVLGTLAGEWVVPAGVSSARMQIVVGETATAGTVWFDDAEMVVTKGWLTNDLERINTDQAAANAAFNDLLVGWWEALTGTDADGDKVVSDWAGAWDQFVDVIQGVQQDQWGVWTGIWNRLFGIQTTANTANTNATTGLGYWQAALTKWGLGSVGSWLDDLFGTKATANTANTNATTSLGYFASALSKWGLGTVGGWLDDLFGTKGTASTANTNASTALGNAAAAQSTANTANTAAGNAQTTANTANTNATTGLGYWQAALTKWGLGSVGSWLDDLFGTKATANTANTNATTSLGYFASALSKWGLGTVGGWLDDLFGTKGTASTANTNASTALGNAAAAQSTANTANTAAGNAQTTANTANTNATTANTGVNAIVTGSGKATPTATGNFLADTWNNLVSGWNQFWDGVFGTTGSTGKTAADVKTAASSVTTTANTADTTANTAIGNAASAAADAQAVADGIHQAVNGGSATGTDLTEVLANLLAFPQDNIAISETAGATAVANVSAGAGNKGTSTSSSWSLTETHTVAATADYLVAAVVRYSLGGTQSVTAGGKAMTNLGWINLSSDSTLLYLDFYGLKRPPTGSQNVVVSVSGITGGSSLCVASAAYSGVGSVSALTAAHGRGSASPAVTVTGSSGTEKVVAALAVWQATNSTAMSAFSQTSRVNVADAGSSNKLSLLLGDATGAASVACSATTSNTDNNYWAAIGFRLRPSDPGGVGSGVRMYRSSTSAVSASSGTNKFTSTFFDSTDRISDDLSASNNTVTVQLSGWYACSIRSELSINVASGTVTLCPVVYRNGSVDTIGPPIIAVNGFGINYAPTCMGGMVWVYANAGDTLEPGYLADTGGTAVLSSLSFKGESSGTKTYWHVGLGNRSLL